MRLTITSRPAQAPAVRRLLEGVSAFLQRDRQTAEQLTAGNR
jgi:hypothetical protein